jgi:L-asparaginase
MITFLILQKLSKQFYNIIGIIPIYATFTNVVNFIIIIYNKMDQERIYLICLTLSLLLIIILIFCHCGKGDNIDLKTFKTQNKKILIINTGGNLAKVHTTEGYKFEKGFLENQLNIMSKNNRNIPYYDIVEYTPPISSGTMNTRNWNRIVTTITKNYNNYDSFIIIHPLETIGYTSSALTFLLDNLKKSIIITGSKHSIHQHQSYGRDNLFLAINIATKYSIPEVLVCYNKNIMRGCRAIFSNENVISPYFPSIATQVKNKIIVDEKNILKCSTEKFTPLMLNSNVNVILIKVFPGINEKYINNIVNSKQKIHGIILQTYGYGKIPLNKKIIKVLKSICKNGTIIIQTNTNNTPKPILENMLVNTYDMTTETAFTKLLFLLSNVNDKKTIIELMKTNMKGELTN